ncbi:1-hydroxycarotenoid 3,4-desaturase CrtD [Rhodovibrio salinarum]|uniref:Phytoene desaturase n=1 Tax=Rhodovibrio salinarum TaxID=1087 RepID=A0A934QGG8_9PROT|nr:1-hydroxycarotenoid 3,4-desaturase CrtD [Rhodovibrio salinarum]MBK1696354.1 phytoene desaturase [Rhodovibrio salinarum]
MKRAGERIVVIGGGVAGLVSALKLAARGLEVTLVERQSHLGGKMRALPAGDTAIDAGPTVFTMRQVFDELAQELGERLEDIVSLRPADRLARHAWDGDDSAPAKRLDLFADVTRSAEAIAAFSGPAEAKRYKAFTEEARKIYATLDRPFLRSPKATPVGLMQHAGPKDLWGIKPFDRLWDALGRHFHDPRLRQLFGRYATYCGSSPFQAPATLMLVAHVEQSGVWLIDGGMHTFAQALAELAQRHGVTLYTGREVREIELAGNAVSGVRLDDGTHLQADAVVCNADVAALADGKLGRRAARAAPQTPTEMRSLSAMTWTFLGSAGEFPLLHHNVLFCRDYKKEFADIFDRRRLPDSGTVYICAQDRSDGGELSAAARERGSERLFMLVNAPPTGDRDRFDEPEITACEERHLALLSRCNLDLSIDRSTCTVTTPKDFARLFPGTGGALYGRASHGWRASFQRPPIRTRLTGLYLAGGSAHPGPGVPMAAMSGRLAAECLLADWGISDPTRTAPGSISRSRRAATSGGTSTR